ncbi:MAG: hypothetical protein QF662_03680 [Phycisphaerae bacterium]|nr:hypothetical protein [Phycisphaerae bacterium]
MKAKWFVIPAMLLSAAVSLSLAAPQPITKGPAAQEPIRYGKGRKLSDLANKQIRESSGLACSRRRKGVFWTHNDSGDAPRIFAFNLAGDNLATYTIAGAKARDWEDMASFKMGKRAYLLLADVGNNSRRRKEVTIYIIPEPPLDVSKRSVKGTVRSMLTIRFSFEDGNYDCESVAIDPTEKIIYLVPKVLGSRTKIYALPLPRKPGAGGAAKAVAKVSIPTAVAMDISPDGLRAVVLTYGSAREYTRRPGEKWAQAFSRKPRKISMPSRRQGESICYGADGETLYLTSEKLPTPLLEVPVIKPNEKVEKDGPAR